MITRRDLAVAGALALSVPSLLFSSPALAEAGDEAAVRQNVEALREALLKADKAQLERLTADQTELRAFGRQGPEQGRVHRRRDDPEGDGQIDRPSPTSRSRWPATRRSRVISMNPNPKLDGKPTNVRIGTLEVWQKQGGNWKLLARQGYKLA